MGDAELSVGHVAKNYSDSSFKKQQHTNVIGLAQRITPGKKMTYGKIEV